MKKILLLFTLVFSSSIAKADCSSNGLYFYPVQKEISLNSIFIIEGYYNSQKIIEAFDTRPIYLVTEKGETIQLVLQNIYVGQMQLTQAVFKPVKALNPNTKYYLQYSNQTKTEATQLEKWNSIKKKKERVYWITTEEKTNKPLNSNLTIEYKKTDIAFYGCGPAAYAVFSIINKPDNEIWYKTEVIDLSTSKSSIYLIKSGDGTLSVGHGMCSGSFTFNQTGKYKVRFTPMNSDGKTLNTTNWIAFNSPFMNN